MRGTNAGNTYDNQFYFGIYLDKLQVFLYDQSHQIALSNNYARLESVSVYNFIVGNIYTVQFSWNNTTKSYNLVVNRNDISATQGAGNIAVSSLDIKTTSTQPLSLGARTLNNWLNPFIRIGRFRFWTKSHTLSELQNLYDDLITT